MKTLNIPVSLILFRFILSPIIILLAILLKEKSNLIIITLMYLGLVSDILDGIIARKQGVSTEKLRRLDSQTDMIFWLSIGFSSYILYPELIRDNSYAIWAILVMEAMCYVISFLKFGKETCTHAFLSKIWGLTLLIAFTSLIGFQQAGFPFYLAIVIGLIAHIDVILIILILPKWTHDIPSSYHAYLLRKGKKITKHKLLNS
ncbi:CDP-diacylglycerol--glycerol-3-phosphate 3-phosphatidyltransferase [Tenacibaculum sp. MAR_2009_124]|uniref:CDP-alcohol phosphatidyltransferase family protein n=1 Tax=Tenacibaculum sp. MAR_2009_124 TaxID=1250059 RepID=UPI00089B63AB|nr:CDP-alcohol phosphatidyltransferase family protein [Tenacibaculum sp. MAR_2009_124]SEC83758.1 CDP-diacylglycerol--glycerol-3-phosphate 3-phosphatidyltransferase [Tenacibaculum sp. MAR_2009_124]